MLRPVLRRETDHIETELLRPGGGVGIGACEGDPPAVPDGDTRQTAHGPVALPEHTTEGTIILDEQHVPGRKHDLSVPVAPRSAPGDEGRGEASGPALDELFGGFGQFFAGTAPRGRRIPRQEKHGLPGHLCRPHFGDPRGKPGNAGAGRGGIEPDAEPLPGREVEKEILPFPSETDLPAGEQIDPRGGEAVPFPVDAGPGAAVEVEQDEDAAFAVRPQGGDDVAASGLHEDRPGLGEKRRVSGQKSGQFADKTAKVFPRAEIQCAAAVDVDLLRSEKLRAVGESEGASRGEQRADKETELRISLSRRGQTRIVVGLGETHQSAALVTGVLHVRLIAGDLVAGVILEELGVAPVQPFAREEKLLPVGGTAQPLQQKNGVGILPPHPGSDVLPCLGGQHVARVAPETVHAAGAPEEEDPGHELVHLGLPVVELAQIGPDDAPGAGTLELAVTSPDEVFGVPGLKFRRPPRVVDRDIHEDQAVPGMDGVDEFAELFQRRGPFVEVRQRGIDVEIVKRSEGTAVAAHPSVLRRDGMHRQKLEDPAAEDVENVVQTRDEISEGPRGRDDREAFFVQLLDDPGQAGGFGQVHQRPELPDERGVDAVGARRPRRLNLEAEVLSRGPEDPAAVSGDETALGLEHADLGQRQTDLPDTLLPFHGDVVPVRLGNGRSRLGMGNDLFPADGSPSEIRPHDGASRGRNARPLDRKYNGFAGKENRSLRRHGLSYHSASP